MVIPLYSILIHTKRNTKQKKSFTVLLGVLRIRQPLRGGYKEANKNLLRYRLPRLVEGVLGILVNRKVNLNLTVCHCFPISTSAGTVSASTLNSFYN